jgi:hypothetical protein
MVPIMGGHIAAPFMRGPSRWSLPVIAPLHLLINFPGIVHVPVPSIVFGGGHSRLFAHVNHPHAHASLASTLASAASLLCPICT